MATTNIFLVLFALEEYLYSSRKRISAEEDAGKMRVADIRRRYTLLETPALSSDR